MFEHGDVLGLSGLGTDRGVADERQRYRERDEQRAQDERVNEPERRSIQFHRRKKDDEHADDPAPWGGQLSASAFLEEQS